jgi:hypothetical protein
MAVQPAIPFLKLADATSLNVDNRKHALDHNISYNYVYDDAKQRRLRNILHCGSIPIQ